MPRHKKRSASTAADLRPIAKTLVKRALRAFDVAKGALTQAGEKFESLVKEARAEMKDGKPSKKPTKKKPR